MNKNTRRIDWLNHSLEFIVVLIGILIAFQLNQCSVDKEQSEIIQVHLDQIKEEAIFNKNNFEEAIDYLSSNLIKLDTISQLIKDERNFDRVNILTFELLNLGGVYIRKNAYLTLTESGDIRFLKDYEKKNKLINLYEYYRWVEAFDEVSTNLYTTDFYPYVRENFDFVGATIQDKTVYTSKLYKNIIEAYRRTDKNRLVRYRECLEQIEKYLKETNKSSKD